MSSALEFVEGGVQDACDDACSICLESFSLQDPASVTDCNHEYHLQCILEWSQRSTGCPMCWQPLHLQDASSQELLASMEQERTLRQNHIQASLLSRHRSGDYDFHQFPESFEERLMQHFAAAVGHSNELARVNHRPSVAGPRPSQFLIFPTYSTVASSGLAGHDEPISASRITRPFTSSEKDETGTSYGQQRNTPAGAYYVDRHGGNNMQTHSSRQSSPLESASTSQYGSSTSDLQSFSETIKSRLTAVSSRYKESFARIFRERLRSRNGATQDTSVGISEGSSSVVGGGASGPKEDIIEPHPDVTIVQHQIAEDALTDVNPVLIANGEKHEDGTNPRDPGATETSSEPVADEGPPGPRDETVRTGHEEPLEENTSILSVM